MRFKLTLTLIFAFCLLPIFQARAEDSLIGRMQKVEASIVDIRTVYSKTLTTKSGRKGIASYERHGAGLIIDPAGLIVTNAHIVINAPKILVTLNGGETCEANILYSNTASDFSFIKISPPKPLQPIRWAESSELNLGDKIIALGNSEINSQSIISGEITSILTSKATGAIEFLEVNINLYQGDSGGPILDQQGRLLGLIMGKRLSQDRQSYAIASDKIRREYLNYR